jgi:acetyl-CoA C-acetyltransferase
MHAAEVWVAAGVRTPFIRAGCDFTAYDSLALSKPVAQGMLSRLRGDLPDFAVWGEAMPAGGPGNLARDVLLDAGCDAAVPAFAASMACSTSMVGAIIAAGMIDGRCRTLALVGGVESMSRAQSALMHVPPTRSHVQAVSHDGRVVTLRPKSARPCIFESSNRLTGLSVGTHTEITAREWMISRQDQDALASTSHHRATAAWEAGFFDDLVVPTYGVDRDGLPRDEGDLERLRALRPIFDRTTGVGTITAGNSAPPTDGAAGVWVGSEEGMARLPCRTPKARLVDYEIAGVDFRDEGILMATAFAVPRLLTRHGLTLKDVAVWEIHEAFTAQLAFHIKAWEDPNFLSRSVGVGTPMGTIRRDLINPNGGSVALGHPFGATGARVLSQAVKELSAKPPGSRAVVSICADGGLGSAILLQSP